MSRARSGVLFLALLLSAPAAACADRTLFVESAWPSDHDVVVVAVDGFERPAEPAPRLFRRDEPVMIRIDDPTIVRLYIETFPRAPESEPSLEECGVMFGGSKRSLPDPSTSWVAEGFAGPDGGGLRLRDAEPVATFDLRYERCDAPASDPCGDVGVTTFRPSSLTNISLDTVAVVSRDLAFAGGINLVTDQQVLSRVDADHGAVLLDTQPVGGVGIGLVWDEGAGVLFAAWTSGEILQTDRDGRTIASAIIRGPGLVGMAGDGSGRVFVFDGSTVRAIEARSSTVSDVTPEFPPGTTKVRIVSSERQVALAEEAIFERLGSQPGARWVRALDGNGVSDPDTALAGNAEVLAAVGRSDIRIRSEDTGRWLRLAHPFISGATDGGAAVGSALLVVGSQARAALWTGSAWCAIGTGGLSALRGVDSTPDGRFALSVGRGTLTSEGPLITRFDLPILPRR